MKEIKQTKSKKCVDWISSHIVMIGVIAFAIGLFLSSCHFAKAEDFSEDMWTLVAEDLDTYNSSTSLSTIQSAYMSSLSDYDQTVTSTISKFVRFEVSSSYQGSVDGTLYYFCLYDNAVYSVSKYLNTDLTSFNFSLDTYESAPDASLSNDNVDRRFYLLRIKNNSSASLHNHRTQGNHYVNISLIDVGYTTDISSVYISGSYRQFAHLLGDSSFSAYGDLYSSNIISYGDNYFIDSNWRVAYYGTSMSYETDSRLKFATWSDALGRSILHVDMTDYLNSTGFNISNTALNDFTLSIDYSISNSSDIENHTISYNNSSEYYTEYGENGKLTKIYMNIPYSEFYGFNYDSNSFPDYDNVIIQNAIINLDLVPVGGNTSVNITSYVDCLYYLQHVYDDITPEILPLPEYDDTFVQDAQDLIDSINELHAGSSYYTDGDFTFASPISLPDWADVWEYDLTYATIGSDNEYLGDFYPYPYDVNGSAQIQDVNDIIYEFTDEKYGYYDVVRLRVFRARINSDIDVSVTYLDTVYIYLYTERYFVRKDALTNIDILKMLQQSATNDVSFFESIRERIDDFEEKTLVAMTGSDNSIFAYINNLDTDLNSGISRIIDSMPVFNWTPFNDDDILMALYTIVNNQENPKDGYARYIAWVKSERSAENGFKVWADDMFDVFHDVYNFFNYQDDINPNETGLQKYVDYVKLYIQYLTQQTDGISSNEYVYYKGIFDNTYDLHDVNG